MTQSLESLLRSSLKAPSGPRLRRTSQLLSLEQRFMFDGAAVVDAAHAAQAPDAAVAAVPPAVTVREAEPAKDSGKKEVALVDTSVANYKALEAGVRATAATGAFPREFVDVAAEVFAAIAV